LRKTRIDFRVCHNFHSHSIVCVFVLHVSLCLACVFAVLMELLGRVVLCLASALTGWFQGASFGARYISTPSRPEHFGRLCVWGGFFSIPWLICALWFGANPLFLLFLFLPFAFALLFVCTTKLRDVEEYRVSSLDYNVDIIPVMISCFLVGGVSLVRSLISF
jgi:hypothetical protein